MRRWLYRAAADILTRAVNALEWRLADHRTPCAACDHPTSCYVAVCDQECWRLLVLSQRFPKVPA